MEDLCYVFRIGMTKYTDHFAHQDDTLQHEAKFLVSYLKLAQ